MNLILLMKNTNVYCRALGLTFLDDLGKNPIKIVESLTYIVSLSSFIGVLFLISGDQMNKYMKLVMWVLSLQLVSSLFGLFMRKPVDTWYLALERSPLSPPNYVFGIVWPLLYLMIAVAGWMIWQMKSDKQAIAIKRAFILQMILNWSWSPLFFNLHLIGFSLFVILLILALVGYLVYKLFAIEKQAALLLAPYFFWLCFASYLNYYIVINN